MSVDSDQDLPSDVSESGDDVIRCPPFCASKETHKHHDIVVTLLNRDDAVWETKLTEQLAKYCDAILYCDVMLCCRHRKEPGFSADTPLDDEDENFRLPALHWACALGNEAAVGVLLRLGCTADTVVDAGSALHAAIHRLTSTGLSSKKATAIFRSFLELCPAALYTTDRCDNTVLLSACHQIADDSHYVQIQFASAIIPHIINAVEPAERAEYVNMVNSDYESALRVLCGSSREREKNLFGPIKALLREEADPFATDIDGKSSVELAADASLWQVRDLLRDVKPRDEAQEKVIEKIRNLSLTKYNTAKKISKAIGIDVKPALSIQRVKTYLDGWTPRRGLCLGPKSAKNKLSAEKAVKPAPNIHRPGPKSAKLKRKIGPKSKTRPYSTPSPKPVEQDDDNLMEAYLGQSEVPAAAPSKGEHDTDADLDKLAQSFMEQTEPRAVSPNRSRSRSKTASRSRSVSASRSRSRSKSRSRSFSGSRSRSSTSGSRSGSGSRSRSRSGSSSGSGSRSASGSRSRSRSRSRSGSGSRSSTSGSRSRSNSSRRSRSPSNSPATLKKMAAEKRLSSPTLIKAIKKKFYSEWPRETYNFAFRSQISLPDWQEDDCDWLMKKYLQCSENSEKSLVVENEANVKLEIQKTKDTTTAVDVIDANVEMVEETFEDEINFDNLQETEVNIKDDKVEKSDDSIVKETKEEVKDTTAEKDVSMETNDDYLNESSSHRHAKKRRLSSDDDDSKETKSKKESKHQKEDKKKQSRDKRERKARKKLDSDSADEQPERTDVQDDTPKMEKKKAVQDFDITGQLFASSKKSFKIPKKRKDGEDKKPSAPVSSLPCAEERLLQKWKKKDDQSTSNSGLTSTPAAMPLPVYKEVVDKSGKRRVVREEPVLGRVKVNLKEVEDVDKRGIIGRKKKLDDGALEVSPMADEDFPDTAIAGDDDDDNDVTAASENTAAAEQDDFAQPKKKQTIAMRLKEGLQRQKRKEVQRDRADLEDLTQGQSSPAADTNTPTPQRRLGGGRPSLVKTPVAHSISRIEEEESEIFGNWDEKLKTAEPSPFDTPKLGKKSESVLEKVGRVRDLINRRKTPTTSAIKKEKPTSLDPRLQRNRPVSSRLTENVKPATLPRHAIKSEPLLETKMDPFSTTPVRHRQTKPQEPEEELFDAKGNLVAQPLQPRSLSPLRGRTDTKKATLAVKPQSRSDDVTEAGSDENKKNAADEGSTKSVDQAREQAKALLETLKKGGATGDVKVTQALEDLINRSGAKKEPASSSSVTEEEKKRRERKEKEKERRKEYERKRQEQKMRERERKMKKVEEEMKERLKKEAEKPPVDGKLIEKPAEVDKKDKKEKVAEEAISENSDDLEKYAESLLEGRDPPKPKKPRVEPAANPTEQTLSPSNVTSADNSVTADVANSTNVLLSALQNKKSQKIAQGGSSSSGGDATRQPPQPPLPPSKQTPPLPVPPPPEMVPPPVPPLPMESFNTKAYNDKQAPDAGFAAIKSSLTDTVEQRDYAKLQTLLRSQNAQLHPATLQCFSRALLEGGPAARVADRFRDLATVFDSSGPVSDVDCRILASIGVLLTDECKQMKDWQSAYQILSELRTVGADDLTMADATGLSLSAIGNLAIEVFSNVHSFADVIRIIDNPSYDPGRVNDQLRPWLSAMRKIFVQFDTVLRDSAYDEQQLIRAYDQTLKVVNKVMATRSSDMLVVSNYTTVLNLEKILNVFCQYACEAEYNDKAWIFFTYIMQSGDMKAEAKSVYLVVYGQVLLAQTNRDALENAVLAMKEGIKLKIYPVQPDVHPQLGVRVALWTCHCREEMFLILHQALNNLYEYMRYALRNDRDLDNWELEVMTMHVRIRNPPAEVETGFRMAHYELSVERAEADLMNICVDHFNPSIPVRLDVTDRSPDYRAYVAAPGPIREMLRQRLRHSMPQ